MSDWNLDPADWGAGHYRENFPWSKWVLFARDRQRRDLQKWLDGDPEFPFYWDEAAADKIVWFFKQLRHFDSPWTGQPFILSDWQEWDVLRPLFGWIRRDTHTRRFGYALVKISRKNGKALDLDTRIPTPDGFRTMRDLQVGDRVFSERGKPTRIRAVSEVQNDRPCYVIHFSSGQKIVCDESHLWTVYQRRNQFEKTITTLEIADNFLTGGKKPEYRYKVKIPDPPHLPEKKYSIDPYILGYWLGDGESSGSRISVGDRDLGAFENQCRKLSIPFSVKPDSGGSNWRVRLHKYNQRLRDLNLLNNKHIPEQYLFGSVDQRRSLLQGLMDSDGHCSKAGQCEFTTMSPNIAVDFIRLCGSLGIKIRPAKGQASISGRVVGTKYRIFFTVERRTLPFRLKRKLSRCRENIHSRSKYMSIEHVERIKSRPVRCIQVENPTGLFLCGDLFVPTHNSPLEAGVGLYLMNGDREPGIATDQKLDRIELINGENIERPPMIPVYGAQIYSAATKEDQAKILWNYAEKMTRFGSPIRAHIKPMRKVLINRKLDSTFKPLGGDSDTQDGFSVHGGLIDEWHAHKDTRMRDVLSSGTMARANALIFVATTAGYGGEQSPCEKETAIAEQILDPDVNVENDNFFAFLATVDDPKNWEDPDEWKRANPNWDISVLPHKFEAQYNDAKIDPDKQTEFLVKNLNIPAKSTAKPYMPMDAWKSCADEYGLEDLIDYPCWGGLDVGVTEDLTSFTLAFKKPVTGDPEPHLFLITVTWCPEDKVEKKLREEKVDYPRWVRDGHMITTPGETTRKDQVLKQILELCEGLRVQCIAADRAHASGIMQGIADAGIEIFGHGQGRSIMNAPLRGMRAAAIEGRLHHQADPCLDWMIDNAVTDMDSQERIMLRKDKAKNRIDGAVSSAMACGRALEAEEEQDQDWTVTTT